MSTSHRGIDGDRNILENRIFLDEHEGFVSNNEVTKEMESLNKGDASQGIINGESPQNSKQIDESGRYLEGARNSWEAAKKIGMWSRKEEEVVQELCRRRVAAAEEIGTEKKLAMKRKRGRPRKNRSDK